jgi:hypothetical protein
MIRFDYRVGRVGAEPFVGRELIKNSTLTGKLQFVDCVSGEEARKLLISKYPLIVTWKLSQQRGQDVQNAECHPKANTCDPKNQSDRHANIPNPL